MWDAKGMACERETLPLMRASNENGKAFPHKLDGVIGLELFRFCGEFGRMERPCICCILLGPELGGIVFWFICICWFIELMLGLWLLFMETPFKFSSPRRGKSIPLGS